MDIKNKKQLKLFNQHEIFTFNNVSYLSLYTYLQHYFNIKGNVSYIEKLGNPIKIGKSEIYTKGTLISILPSVVNEYNKSYIVSFNFEVKNPFIQVSTALYNINENYILKSPLKSVYFLKKEKLDNGLQVPKSFLPLNDYFKIKNNYVDCKIENLSEYVGSLILGSLNISIQGTSSKVKISSNNIIKSIDKVTKDDNYNKFDFYKTLNNIILEDKRDVVNIIDKIALLKLIL